MAERDFVERLEKSGFTGIEIMDRRPWGIEDCARYPLFDRELIALMRKVIPPECHDRVAESVVVRARLGR
ncbi:MAG TPA: hypothetical protein VJ927_10005 [Actinomycetota bacterium]|nr:hypothetical protein [Actinomycetota bacterium]